MLHRHDGLKPMILTTDASGTGLGAVLSQANEDGEVPIAFISKALTDNQKKWSTWQREAKAVVWAITSLKHYLRGKKFTLRTDHQALRRMREYEDSMVARWALLLAEYQFEVEVVPGTAIPFSDMLSRQHDEHEESLANEAPFPSNSENCKVKSNAISCATSVVDVLAVSVSGTKSLKEEERLYVGWRRMFDLLRRKLQTGILRPRKWNSYPNNQNQQQAQQPP
eukprot:GHVP01003448.1.p1 GENE.GHVP01003448.1~~GHVP01003448.1.p1  ORF type:complete len:224 (+),score=30.51 GHVP01003448.1:352-1023(+)